MYLILTLFSTNGTGMNCKSKKKLLKTKKLVFIARNKFRSLIKTIFFKSSNKVKNFETKTRVILQRNQFIIMVK